ncbi:MAG TPA: rhomboid family intramembrane serine protease, partial [Marmoricola sp.]|nr:rhomboid family intramembrane serine protease [Marmoricola sp.]
GFQCPECVRDGARTTRQARGPYGGRVAGGTPVVTLSLIGLNVLVWLAVLATGGARSRLVDLLELRPLGLSLRTPSGQLEVLHGVSGGDWWQPITSVFTHVAILHIGFNMVALWFLGPPLESMFGRARFLAVYLVSGLAGSAAVMWLANPLTPSLGASGAIFGLLGALLVVAIKVRGNVQTVLFWLGLNLVFSLTVANISWQAHVGGLVGGILLAAAMVYAPRSQRALVQWGAVALVTALAVVAIVVRVATIAHPRLAG